MQVSTTDFRNKLNAYGNLILNQGKKIIITKSGIPIFEVIPYQKPKVSTDTFSTIDQLAGSIKIAKKVQAKLKGKNWGKIREEAIQKHVKEKYGNL